jgi:hypothetical protein
MYLAGLLLIVWLVPGPESNNRPQGASLLVFGEILNKIYRHVYRKKLMCTRFGSRWLGNYFISVFFSRPATTFAAPSKVIS